MGILALIITLIIVGAFDWLVTAGLVWLITLCFGWEFSFGMTTGVWLIQLLVAWFYYRIKKK